MNIGFMLFLSNIQVFICLEKNKFSCCLIIKEQVFMLFRRSEQDFMLFGRNE